MFYLTTHSTHFIYGYMASVGLLVRVLLVVYDSEVALHVPACRLFIQGSYRPVTRVIS